MKEKKRRSLHNIFAMLFSFALVMVFAGFIGKVDAHAENVTKTFTVRVIDSKTNQIILNATPIVEKWMPIEGDYVNYQRQLIDDYTTNDDGTFTFTVTEDEWRQITVGASEPNNYVTVKVPDSDNGKSGYYLDYIRPTITVKLDKLTAVVKLENYKKAAEDTIRAYENNLKAYDKEDQEAIQNIIDKCSEKIKLYIVSNEDDFETANEQIEQIDEDLAAAESQIAEYKTSQAKINNAYKDKLYFTRDGSNRVPFVGKDENLSISLTLTNYDKGGQFVVGDLPEGATVDWQASKTYQQYVLQFIGNRFSSRPGIFLHDQNKPSWLSYDAGTYDECYVEFTDPVNPTQTKRVTFTLNIVQITITGINVTAPDSVELERNEDFEYTNRIKKVEGGYQVEVESDASTKQVDYVGNATIKSLTPTIAEVKEGVIIPLKSGKAIFEAISDDDTSIKKRFYINFTLSSEEEDELVAAQEVDELIDAIGTVTLASEDTIVAARAAYKALGDDFGRGVHDAQSKVKKLSVLVAAESRLQELKDIKEAADVDEIINDIGTVSLDSVSTINLAEGAYANLNDNAKKLVKGHETLIEARERLTILQVYKTNGETIADLIAAIDENAPETDEWADAILDAKEAYDSIETEEERKFIDTNFGEAIDNLSAAVEALGDWNEDKLATADAAKVEKMIKNLGEISLAKESDVQAARAAYEKLSANAKTKISAATMAVLTSAEGKVTALKEAEAKKAQEAANAAPAPTIQLDKITLKVKAGKAKATLTWKKSSKADGYIIYRATKKNGKYKQIKVIKSWKKTSFTDKKVKSKKTYYYKICPYKGTVNGPVSAAKKAIVK